MSSSFQGLDHEAEGDKSEMERSQMWTRAARIESFSEPPQSQKAKNARISSQSNSSVQSGNSRIWPHKRPTPEQLARAGFYFHNANIEDQDSTKCFSCGLKLDGWQPEDDPLQEHYAHGKQEVACAWTISLSVWRNEGDEPEERDPFCDELYNARKDTFGDKWPHESKRAWRCKVERMVDAGWSYDPTTEGVDEVCCHYCDLRLSEFKARDDPYEEHKRRRPECTFFELVDRYHNGAPPKRPKSKAKNARASRASKTARASVQSIMSTAVPDIMDIDDGATDILANDELNAANESQPDEATSKTKRNTRVSKTTSKTVKAVQSQTAQDEEQESDNPDQNNAAKEKARKAATKKTKNTSKKASQSTKGRTKKESAVEKRTTDVSQQLQEELESSVLDGSPNYWVNPDQRSSLASMGGSKRSSDGSLKYGAIDDSELDFPMPPSAAHQDEPKTKRAKTVRSSKVQNDTARSSKAVKRTKVSAASQQPDDEEEIALELARLESEEKTKNIVHKSAKSSYSKSQQSHTEDVVHVLQDDSDLAISSDEEPVAKTAPVRKPAAQAMQTISLTPSPASSDKENNPSSLDTVSASKDNAKTTYMSPTKTSRVPLAQTTPNRPSPYKASALDSPSKRQLGTITSTVPWKAIDLDTVLLDPAQDTPGKLRQQLADAGGALSLEESAMTVEGWIRWRASLCEDQAKRRCEEMVAAFEREGNRALECLHGLKITA